MKNTLEKDFDRLLTQEPIPTVEQCARIVMKHAPKNPKNWSIMLRRLADYVDALPEPVELNPKALLDIIKLSLREKD